MYVGRPFRADDVGQRRRQRRAGRCLHAPRCACVVYGLDFAGVELTTTNCLVLSGDRRCAAIILVFFAVAGSFWWLTLTFNIFELLVLGMKRELVKKIYYFQHILNWGVPTVCVIIGAPSLLPPPQVLGHFQAPLLMLWSADLWVRPGGSGIRRSDGQSQLLDGGSLRLGRLL